MSKQPHDKILSRTDYEPLLEQIDKYNQSTALSEDQYKQYLSTYIQLLQLRDHGYPLLLRNGASHHLDAQPLSVHLLPPIPAKDDRWLLLTFLTENLELQTQIIEWTIAGNKDAPLQPLADPETVCTEKSLALNGRFFSINFIETNGHCLITLTFQEGILNVTTNHDHGIISTAWSKKTTPGPVIERSSWGQMNEAIRIRRNPEGNWQNDSILDHENHELGKGTFNNGWIRGADSPEDKPDWVYMATNQANVICIDKTNPDGLLWESSSLEGKALDALVVHFSGLEGHAILASTDNGMVYLLIPDHEKVVFKEKYVQLAGPRIERCIGSGSEHLLTLDSRNILSPLLVTNPERFWDIRDSATQKLTTRFFQNKTNHFSHHLPDHNRLLLEYYLFGLGDQEVEADVLKLFATLCDNLNNEITHALSENNQDKLHEWAALQHGLMSRFFKWLKRSTTHQQLHMHEQEKAQTLDMIWKLITPNQSLPDYVCLPLLRESAWLRRWATKQEVINHNKAFKKKLAEWEADLQIMRKTFAEGLHTVRNLNTLNHYQLDSHCDHIEILDEHEGIIAVLEYTGDLLIFQINNNQWHLLAPNTNTQKNAESPRDTAQRSFIHVLPDIEGKKPSKHKIYLITGSSRGELTLICFNGSTRSLEIKSHLECPAHLVCCLTIPEQKGVLLGGYNPNEKAVLYGWSYAKILRNQPPRLLWEDDPLPVSISSMRQLRLSGDGSRIWVMNREKGYLYCWGIPSGLFDRKRFPAPESILRTTRNLYALDYSSNQNLLVCGGVGGMAYAFDSQNGSCYWTVICSGNLRRVVFLPNYPVPGDDQAGAWLLCGDDQSSLIVDSHGNVTGIIKKAGPICASAIYHERQQVVLCTLDGRLMLMDYSSSPCQSDAMTSANNPLSYPVRNQSPISNPKLMSKMLNMDSYDSHSNMAVLYKFSNYLEHPPVDEELQARFLKYWCNQSLERRIMFLYWLRNNCLNNHWTSDPNNDFVLTMAETAWRNFNEYAKTGLSCKLVSPLFDMLNQLKQTDSRAQDLLATITDAVWKNQNDTGVTDSHSALAAIRWNQSAKCWKIATKKHTPLVVDIEVLFNWCALMAKECNASNTDELKQSFSLLAHLHLYNPPQDHAPSQWLLQFFKPESPTTSVDLAFQHLETPTDKPFSRQQLDELNQLLPDNSIWLSWLQELQSILKLLEKRQGDRPHIAWQEQESWEMLHEHISATGKHRFSVPKDQAMLALYWPKIVDYWTDFIEKGYQKLDQSVRKHTNDYLQITGTDRWEGNQCVVLDLRLSNRFPEELRLEKINIIKVQSDTDDKIKQCHTQFPISLPASEHSTPISVSIKTSQPDWLDCGLQLECHLIGGSQPVLIDYPIKKGRNLLRLSEQPLWKPTWDRLANLLTEWDSHQQPFYWINGHSWPEHDRTHLWNDVLAKYPLHPQTETRKVPMDKLLLGVKDSVFSPDLALGATPETLLEQLHSLLKPIANEQSSYWAMAIWHAGKPLPEQVGKALSNILPNQRAIVALLDNLLEESNRTPLLNCIKDLPPSAFGAWCAEEPFYTPKDRTVDTREIYPASSALLPLTFWQIVDQANVSISELAHLLMISSDQARVDQHSRQLFYPMTEHLFENRENRKLDVQRCEPVVRQLVSRLGSSGVNAESAMWWSFTTITLNWQDYTICYLLPKCSADMRRQMRELADKKHRSEHPLWLCFGETSPLDDLPGLAIGISYEETLALMHVNKPEEAAQRLNQIVARLYGVSPYKTFRPAGGLGSLVDRHFGGREKALTTLWACLEEADKKGDAALIVGSRRIGKTTLRERIRFEIDHQQPERVCLEFNFEGKGEDRDRVGIELEFWFFKRMQKAFADAGYTFDDEWPKSAKSNVDKRDRARDCLRNYLDTLKRRTGYVPLFIFDETENLVRWDTASNQECWSLFALFRNLIQEGKLCLFATSYPHGLDSPYSLNVANSSSDNPIYNTFAFPIELDAWLPDTTWDYLSSRLTGLGVVLPRQYRDEILAISCGIPWIVHAMGLHICEQLPQGEKVVYPQTWLRVRTGVLRDIHENLKVSVTKVANDLDLRTGALDTEHLLGNGQLWGAFKTLASQSLDTFRPNANNWSQPMQFSLDQLAEQLPKVNASVLREALRRLSSSPVMEGIARKENQFLFSNNLLPAWIQHTQG